MLKSTTSARRAIQAAAYLVLTVLLSALPLPARDVFVLLSGGGTQMDNNYSQYLQARAMAEFFYSHYPQDSVWAFFGAGNVEGAKPIFSDVYREVKRDGVLVDTWLPGTIPHNRPATREEFLPALRREILPAVADGGTLYLFVGDHGSRSSGRNPESVIVLWGLYRDEVAEHGWSLSGSESLGVAELRRILAAGIGRGRVVFCMTQCHAGGFHYLGIPHEMSPDPAWFTSVPSWARRRPTAPTVRAAGFSATDEWSLAAGCDPSPDPEEWAGYERYLPENLLGMNLFTREHTGEGLKSFAEAHVAAATQDRTIDKPRSTSEQYLERWSSLIESHLLRESHLTSVVKKAVADYQRTVDGRTPKLVDAAFLEREETFRGFTERLASQNDAAVLLTGTRAELEDAMKDDSTADTSDMQMPRPPSRGSRRTAKRLWSQTVRPAWAAAVETNGATGLPAAVVGFEKHLLDEEDRGIDYLFGDGGDMQDAVYWQSGYGDPATLNTARADAIALWAEQRNDKIIAWAKSGTDQDLRDAANRLGEIVRQQEAADDAANQDDKAEMKATASERALFYRRTLGAWVFLLEVNDRPALAELRTLTELERTPLPQAK